MCVGCLILALQRIRRRAGALAVPQPFPDRAQPARRHRRARSPPCSRRQPAPALPPAPRPTADGRADRSDCSACRSIRARSSSRSYDAGRGQRYYLFGSAASFVDLVAYYRNVLKQKGELIFDVPATHEFDVGRFREETMAFPPGVTIKDFQSDVSQGYPNPKPGGQPARFPTIIQIVPVAGTTTTIESVRVW